MEDDPRKSVVDHGVDNIYVVSTSVYRTDGQANSTFLAVTLAMRLANHLYSATANSVMAETQALVHTAT